MQSSKVNKLKKPCLIYLIWETSKARPPWGWHLDGLELCLWAYVIASYGLFAYMASANEVWSESESKMNWKLWDMQFELVNRSIWIDRLFICRIWSKMLKYILYFQSLSERWEVLEGDVGDEEPLGLVLVTPNGAKRKCDYYVKDFRV